MGEQRAAGGAQGLDEARGPDHRGRAVFAAGAERGGQGVRVLGRGVQQPAPVRVQARGKRDGQGADQNTQSAEGRRPATSGRVAATVRRRHCSLGTAVVVTDVLGASKSTNARGGFFFTNLLFLFIIVRYDRCRNRIFRTSERPELFS